MSVWHRAVLFFGGGFFEASFIGGSSGCIIRYSFRYTGGTVVYESGCLLMDGGCNTIPGFRNASGQKCTGVQRDSTERKGVYRCGINGNAFVFTWILQSCVCIRFIQYPGGDDFFFAL